MTDTDTMLDKPSQDERNFAALGHALTFIEGGIVGPLIIYVLQKQDKPFSAFHSLQSLYFGLLFLAITVVTCGFGALVVVWPYLVFEVIAAVKSYEGEWYVLPVVGKYALQQHPPPSGTRLTGLGYD